MQVLVDALAPDQRARRQPRRAAPGGRDGRLSVLRGDLRNMADDVLHNGGRPAPGRRLRLSGSGENIAGDARSEVVYRNRAMELIQ
jgi:hypothetical protein